jgi:hypothetical protein
VLQRAGQRSFCWPSVARAPRLSGAGCELFRCQIAETRMRPLAVVLHAPLLDSLARIGERNKDLLVEAFIAQAAIERFDERILDRLARFDEL